MRPSLIAPLTVAFAFGTSLIADELENPAGKKKDDRYPDGASAGDTAEMAIKKFSVAPGLRVDVWAAEPLLANPVALSFDNKGRAFVAETYRRRTSVPDIRKNDAWKIENLALRSVEDRIAFLKAKRPESAKTKPTKDLVDLNNDGQFDWRDWAIESERVKLVIDSNGDGIADQATVFADGFHELETGTGAGVAAHGDSVFYTVIPDVWRFDGEKDGVAAQRTKLLSGFGVHVAYSGHDMHGPKIGPDGKLYWTIADCGARVTTKEGKVVENPDSGAVFRCDLDGAHFEVFATGLRNPQSLAFNDVGDLFTGDNNADGGDKARWTHVVEGADYGWRIGWQFLPKLGAWNSEGMWHLDVGSTNLALLPPVALIGHGPAGIAHYPGTGLPDSYRDHFFYADFPGGVRAFALQPKGASYTADNPGDILQDNSQKKMTGKLLWGLFPSDVAFGVDGGVYVLDWVQGWEKTGKGRIFRVHDPAVDASPRVRETKRTLAAGMEGARNEEVAKLLGHADQRVRFAAQFALVERKEGYLTLKDVALHSDLTLPRLHAIWGMGQVAHAAARANNTTAWRFLLPLSGLLADADAEVRAQAAKTLGTSTDPDAAMALLRALKDSSPRVRFFAAQGLAKAPAQRNLPELALPDTYALIKGNAETDPFIRHAAVQALAHLADPQMLAKRASDASDDVRAAVLLAMRRRGSGEIATFLADKNPQLVLEAARAIHDVPIRGAWTQLAALAGKPGLAAPVAARAINVNFLLGDNASAQRLGRIASDPAASVENRLAALDSLAKWNEPFGRDRIIGLWRDLPPRAKAEGARDIAAQIIPALLTDAQESVRLAAVEAGGSLGLGSLADPLFAVVADSAGAKQPGTVRAAALHALADIESPKLADGVKIALTSTDKDLLEAARSLAAKASPTDAVRLNVAVLGKGSTREQQHALAIIAAQPVPDADSAIADQLDLLIAGKLKPVLHLDVLEAAALRQVRPVKDRLAAYEATRKKGDVLAPWRECTEGGDAKAGKEIFTEKAEAACMRCHKVKGQGGDVGPDLATVKSKGREYILQSIVDPNAVIAPGFESVLLTMKSGDVIAGLLNAETDAELTIASLADGKKQQVKKADVKERAGAPSAMPPGLAEVLGKRGLRDVVEYLATMK